MKHQADLHYYKLSKVNSLNYCKALNQLKSNHHAKIQQIKKLILRIIKSTNKSTKHMIIVTEICIMSLAI